MTALVLIAIAASLGYLFGLATGLALTGFILAASLGFIFGVGLADLERIRRAA